MSDQINHTICYTWGWGHCAPPPPSDFGPWSLPQLSERFWYNAQGVPKKSGECFLSKGKNLNLKLIHLGKPSKKK